MSIDINTEGAVDTRYLKSGKVRLRFKVSGTAIPLIAKALKLAGYQYNHCALDAICQDYISRDELKFTANKSFQGAERFLINLYPDQYESVRTALDLARDDTKSDADALVFICCTFLKFTSPEYYQQKFKKLGITVKAGWE